MKITLVWGYTFMYKYYCFVYSLWGQNEYTYTVYYSTYIFIHYCTCRLLNSRDILDDALTAFQSSLVSVFWCLQQLRSTGVRGIAPLPRGSQRVNRAATFHRCTHTDDLLFVRAQWAGRARLPRLARAHSHSGARLARPAPHLAYAH